MYNSWVEVSASALKHNLGLFKRLTGNKTALMPIIKSNAYGHGLFEVAKIVGPLVKWLGVVSLDEALALRKAGIKNQILVLSYAQSRYLKEGIKNKIDLPIYDLADAMLISHTAFKLKLKARVHFKVDTGTCRLGVFASEAGELIKKIKALPNLELVGIYSHFAMAEDDIQFTQKQLLIFKNFLTSLDKEKIRIANKHFACTAAMLVKPESAFNLARLGLGLYGLWPSALSKKVVQRIDPGFELKPVLSFKTKIIQIKKIPAQSRVGYGCTYVAKKPLTIAVLSCGYFEGYDRKLGNRGRVEVDEKLYPVIGRICMNLMMIDISLVKYVKVGQTVTLIGEKISADDLAKIVGTINYEIVTRINPLLPRIVVK